MSGYISLAQVRPFSSCNIMIVTLGRIRLGSFRLGQVMPGYVRFGQVRTC
jgi:hypothetical protein